MREARFYVIDVDSKPGGEAGRRGWD